MSVESITSIITNYSETKCPDNIVSDIRSAMLGNFNGLLGSVDRDRLIYECPNCYLCCETYLNELACCIFRHGYINGNPLAPHESKDNCDRFSMMPGVEGCCRPYQITPYSNKTYVVRQCGYI